MRARIWVLIGSVLATALYTLFLSDVRPVPLARPLSSVPAKLGDWSSVRAEAMNDQILEKVGVEDYLWREYKDPAGFGVSVYVGYYEQQKEGDQIHSPKHCLPGGGWRPIRSDVIRMDTPGINGGSTRANRYLIGKGEQRQLVLYWYQSQGRDITSEYLAKMWLVVDSIVNKRSDGALIRLMASVPNSEGAHEVQRKMVEFCGLLAPALKDVLPQ